MAKSGIDYTIISIRVVSTSSQENGGSWSSTFLNNVVECPIVSIKNNRKSGLIFMERFHSDEVAFLRHPVDLAAHQARYMCTVAGIVSKRTSFDCIITQGCTTSEILMIDKYARVYDVAKSICSSRVVVVVGIVSSERGAMGNETEAVADSTLFNDSARK